MIGLIQVHIKNITQFDNEVTYMIYLRNKSWKPECVFSFNMGWRILVF
jgi:hypothetical protein